MAVGLLIPGFAAAMGWLFLLHPRIGLVNSWLIAQLRAGGGAVQHRRDRSAWAGCRGSNLAPLAFIMTAAVFRAMDPTLEEGRARCSGAGRWRCCAAITVRLAWPGILAAAIYVFMIGICGLRRAGHHRLGQPHLHLHDLSLSAAQPGRRRCRNTDCGAALSTRHHGASPQLMSWWYGAHAARTRRATQVVTGKGYRPRIVRLGRRACAAWASSASTSLLSKLMPILLLIWASLLPFFQLPSARAFATLSLAHYPQLPWDLVLRRAVRNTAILSGAGADADAGFSLAFSWIVLRSRSTRARRASISSPSCRTRCPTIVFGVGRAAAGAVRGRRGRCRSTARSGCCSSSSSIARLSYGTRMTNGGLIQIHRELEESALMSGASSWDAVAGASSAAAGADAALCLAVDRAADFRELTLAVILSTRRQRLTFPVVVWSLWLGGGLGQASALALVMLR